jgi:hypothetical protein
VQLLKPHCLHTLTMETWGWVRIQKFICFLNITEDTTGSILQQLGEIVDFSFHRGDRLSVSVDVLNAGVQREFSTLLKKARWTIDNVCGHFQVSMQDIPLSLMHRVAENDQTKHFYSTNRVFHTVTGRYTLQDNALVDFKGVRCYDDILSFQRQLTGFDNIDDRNTVFCQMVAASFHFNFPIDLREGPSLFLCLMNGWASSSFMHQASLDQSSLLNFKLRDWSALFHSIERLWSGSKSPVFETAKSVVKSRSIQPRAFFQITRNSIIFVRIAMREGIQIHSDDDVMQPYFVIIASFFAAILSQMGFPMSPAECVAVLFNRS